MDRAKTERVCTVILGVAVLFAALRFYGLNADPPFGLTWSGALFTDEGWYSNSAMRDAHGFSWYIPDDFNPAVTMPLGQLFVRGGFFLLEPSLHSVRLMAATVSVLSIVIWFQIVRLHFGSLAASVTAISLSVSWFAFGFNRLAFMENFAVLFVALCIWALSFDLTGRKTYAIAAIAGVCAACAALVKPSMIFVVPAGLVLILMKTTTLRQAIPVGAAFASVFALVFGSYQVLARVLFAVDLNYFRLINLDDRVVSGVAEWAMNAATMFVKLGTALGLPFASFAVCAIALGLLVDPRLRRSPLVLACLVWIAGSIALSSTINHSPPRYMIPLLPAVAILTGAALASLVHTQWERIRPVLALLYGLGFGVIFYEGALTLRYVLTLEYTFHNMVRGIEQEVLEDLELAGAPLLVGSFADTVSLATGLPSVNSEFSIKPIEMRIAEGLRPSHLVHFTVNEKAVSAILAHGGELTPLKTWDVMQNYYHRIPTELSRITWPEDIAESGN